MEAGSIMSHRILAVIFLFFFCFTGYVSSSETRTADTPPAPEKVLEKNDATLKMLYSIIELKKSLNQRISEKKVSLAKSTSKTEKEQLDSELAKLDKQLNDSAFDFERIATGIDIGLFIEKKPEQFDWKDEVVSLLEPGIKEMKRLTVKARQKTKLKDQAFYYKNLVPVAHDASENITLLISKTTDKRLKNSLQSLLVEWESVDDQLQNKLDIAEMQLLQMEQEEKSLVETSQKSIKNFFRTRGLFLFIAAAACLGVILLLRVSYRIVIRFVPGHAMEYRPFHIRVLDLVFKVVTLLATLFVLVFVFYAVEDWVLLSLAIVFFLGLGWAVKHTLPRVWHQSRLMLNIGSVREGERIIYKNVPWLVKDINFFSKLENPSLGITLRLPIEELLDKASRSFDKNEPWFPCKKNDWVILADGTRGEVTSLSHEMVELVQRGGAHKIYQTGDFLAQSPLNLSMNFRLKVPFGIGYDLQKESTGAILEILESYLQQQIKQEGYSGSMLNFRVEFKQAGASSLDIVVIADFDGTMAPLYNRIKRAIQRWCVDACTINNWDIPFPQLRVHH